MEWNTLTPSTEYLKIDLPEMVSFNYIKIMFYVTDGRTYTWHCDYSADNATWNSLVAEKKTIGSYIEYFSKDINAKHIRVKGTNSVNAFLQLVKFKLDNL
mmetsp:Transcript_33745/g.24775  ORF Transcript_33745/g.24775 Transcript_33745/m.24775 type:complete len:100 (+) Transcript_33745:202-501(+)